MTAPGIEVHFQYIMILDTTKQPSVKSSKDAKFTLPGSRPCIDYSAGIHFFFSSSQGWYHIQTP